MAHAMENKFVLFSSNLVSARFVIGKVRTTSARPKCRIPNAKIVKSIALLVLARLLPRRLSFPIPSRIYQRIFGQEQLRRGSRPSRFSCHTKPQTKSGVLCLQARLPNPLS